MAGSGRGDGGKAKARLRRTSAARTSGSQSLDHKMASPRAIERMRRENKEKRRELETTRLRVRPKDIATLQRAKALVAKTQGAVDEQRRDTAKDLAAVQVRIDRLARQQRERLELSHRRRGALLRERLEVRILREALAEEMAGTDEGMGDDSWEE